MSPLQPYGDSAVYGLIVRHTDLSFLASCDAGKVVVTEIIRKNGVCNKQGLETMLIEYERVETTPLCMAMDTVYTVIRFV